MNVEGGGKLISWQVDKLKREVNIEQGTRNGE